MADFDLLREGADYGKNGVMGSWTPGLLNANQALYQLSYNPEYVLNYAIS